MGDGQVAVFKWMWQNSEQILLEWVGRLMVLKILSKFELRRFCRTTGSVSLVRGKADRPGDFNEILDRPGDLNRKLAIWRE